MHESQKTHEQPRVYLIRVNGEEILRPIGQRLEEAGYCVEEIAQYELLQEENPHRLQAISLIYPYKRSRSRIDEHRFQKLVRRYSTTPIFVVGKRSALTSIHGNGNVNTIELEQLQSKSHRQKTLDELVQKISDVQTQTAPKGVVALYDPEKILQELRSDLRSQKFWTERSESAKECLSDIELARDFLDALILDYNNPEDGNFVIREVRAMNPTLPIIALVKPNHVDNYNRAKGKADHMVIKSKKIPWAHVKLYLRQALEERHAQQVVERHDTVRMQVNAQLANRVFLIMGPPASGKTSATNFVADFLGPDRGVFIKKYSTRPLRFYEKDGVDFIKIDDEKFEFFKNSGKFLYAFEIRGSRYGVPRANTVDALKSGKQVLMVCRDFAQLDEFEKIFAENCGVVPIMLFADYETLEERIKKRKEEPKDRTERLVHLRTDEKMFSANYQRFPYRFYTDRGVTVMDTARRINAVIHWESAQRQRHPFEETHALYVNQILSHMVGMQADEVCANPAGATLHLDPEEVHEYAATNRVNGVESLIDQALPVRVIAAKAAYGHLGVFFNGHGNERSKYTMLARTVLLDLIEHRLKRAGFFPKTRSRIYMPEDFSRFAFLTHPKETMIDGLLYSLTDDYIFREPGATPHAVSFGFIEPSAEPAIASFEQLERSLLLETQRGNNPYDNEIKRAFLKAYRPRTQ